MTTTRDRKPAGRVNSDWRKSQAFESIRQKIRTAASEDPALAADFAIPVDTNPPATPLVKRAQKGEFAASVVEEKYGAETLAHLKAITGAGD
jgi:hypothetical protein